MFSAHKQLYFVLKNEGETYFLDSMLRLRPEEYLWYQLQKNDYSSVFFLTGAAGEKAVISVRDPESYRKNTCGGGLFGKGKKLWAGKKEPYTGPMSVTVPAQEAARWLLERLEEPKTALVCKLDLLNSLFSREDPSPEKLLERLSLGKASLVVEYPMEPSAKDLEDLVGKDSIFRYRGTKGELFTPLYALLTSGNSSAAIFDELLKSVPEQMAELGHLDYLTLQTLVRNVEFALGKQFEQQSFWDHVNYLHYWLEYETVRQDAKGLFGGIQGAVTRKKLFEALTQGGLKAMEEREEVLRRMYRMKHPDQTNGPLLAWALLERYGPKQIGVQSSHVFLEDAALKKLEQMPFPKDYDSHKSIFSIRKLEKHEWEDMRRNLRKPRNGTFDTERTNWIQAFLSYVAPAADCGDTDTLHRAMNLLMYCGNNLYTVPQGKFADYCKRGKKYLDVSKEFYTLRQNYLKLQGAYNPQEPAMKAKEAKLMEYHEILRSWDTIYLETGTITSAIDAEVIRTLAGEELPQEPAKPGPSQVSRLAEDMSDEEALNLLEN